MMKVGGPSVGGASRIPGAAGEQRRGIVGEGGVAEPGDEAWHVSRLENRR
jgi:hypothetical protein